MKRFIVALVSGGLSEDPDISYSNFRGIDASSPEEAVKIYNEENNCVFYYGKCIGEVINGMVAISEEFLLKMNINR